MTQTSIFSAIETPSTYTREDCNDPRLVFDLEELVSQFRGRPLVACDTETTGLHPERGDRIFSIQFFTPETGARVLDLRFVNRERALDAVRFLFGPKGIRETIWANSAYDLKMLLADNVHVESWVWCTQVVGQILDETQRFSGGYSLAALCEKYEVPEQDRKTGEVVRDWLSSRGLEGYHHVPPALMVDYAAQDVVATWALFEREMKDLESQLRVTIPGGSNLESCVRVECEVTREIGWMESTGHAIDVPYLEGLVEPLSLAMREAESEFASLVGRDVELGKDHDVFGAMVGDLEVDWPEWAEGSMDKNVMNAIDHPSAKLVLQYRENEKALGYVNNWLEHEYEGTVYPSIYQNGAVTYRMSCGHPNLQNVPVRTELGKRIRRGFVTRPGYTNYYFDYSQIEFRLFAYYSGQADLVQGYQTDDTFDIHQKVSEMMGMPDDRKRGKTLNFGMLYGMGVEKLSKNLGVTLNEGKKLLDQYHNAVPTIGRLRGKLKRAVNMRGFVENRLGARRRLEHKFAWLALNHLIQGCAASVLKHALPRIGPPIREAGGRILMPIHDEVIFQLPGSFGDDHAETLFTVKEHMEDFPMFNVPIRVDSEFSETNWSEKEEFYLED